MSNSVTFLVQGPIYDGTKNLCKRIKDFYPDSYLILVTWKGQKTENINFDKLIELDDPGCDKIYLNNEVINYENTSRQYLSTRSGILACNTSYILKIRSDFEITFKIDLNKLSSEVGDKILVSNINTIDPLSYLSYIGHIADWFYFAKTKKLKEVFFNVTIPKDYFVSEGSVNKNNFKFGKYTAEQIMLKGYLDLNGNFDNSKYYSFNKTTKIKYLRYLCLNFEIIKLHHLGFEFKKYSHFYRIKIGHIKAFIGFWLVTISPYVLNLYRKKIILRNINFFEKIILDTKYSLSRYIIK